MAVRFPSNSTILPVVPGLSASLILFSLSSAVQAVEWDTRIELPIEVEYTDNLFLTTDNPITDTILYAGVNLFTTVSDEVNRFHLTGEVEAQRYQRTESANAEYYAVATGYTRFTPFGEWGLDATYREQSTRRSDTETIGLVYLFGKRKTYRLTPRLIQQVTDASEIRVLAEFSQNEYTITGPFDYRNTLASLSWVTFLSESWSQDINLTAQRYETLDVPYYQYDYGSLTLSYTHTPSENTELNLGAGIGYLLQEQQEDYTTHVLHIRFRKSTEFSNIYLLAENQLTPTSAARVSRLSAVEAGFDRDISEATRIDGMIRGTRSLLIGSSPEYTTDNLNASVGLNNQIAEAVRIRVFYQYTNNTSSLLSTNRVANSYHAQLNITLD